MIKHSIVMITFCSVLLCSQNQRLYQFLDCPYILQADDVRVACSSYLILKLMKFVMDQKKSFNDQSNAVYNIQHLRESSIDGFAYISPLEENMEKGCHYEADFIALSRKDNPDKIIFKGSDRQGCYHLSTSAHSRLEKDALLSQVLKLKRSRAYRFVMRVFQPDGLLIQNSEVCVLHDETTETLRIFTKSNTDGRSPFSRLSEQQLKTIENIDLIF